MIYNSNNSRLQTFCFLQAPSQLQPMQQLHALLHDGQVSSKVCKNEQASAACFCGWRADWLSQLSHMTNLFTVTH
jgi:hypothetical protein